MSGAARGWLGTRVRDVSFLLLAFGLTLLMQRSAPVQSDEGYTLNAAWQLWNGMRMYDDFRLFVGPASGYAVYFIWRVVGSPSLLAARLLSLGFFCSATTGIWLILRGLGVRAIGLTLAVTAWLASSALYVVMNHNPFSSFAAVWFLYLFLRAAGSGRPRDHFFAGAAAGAVFWFLQTKGVLLAVAAGTFALVIGHRERRRGPALAVAVGFLATLAPLFVIWRPAVLAQEWFLVPFTGNYLGHSTGSPALAVAAIIGAVALLLAAVRSGDRAQQALAVTQAALAASTLHNMEPSHLAINLFPAIVLGARALERRLPPTPIAPLREPLLPMAAIVLLFTAMAFSPLGGRFLRQSALYVDLIDREPRIPLVGERIAAAHAVYAGPFLPGFYYLLRKKNPFFVSETIVCGPDCQRRLVAQLAAVQPELALLQYEMVEGMGYDPTGPVDSYFRERYVLCAGHFGEGLIVRALDPGWCPQPGPAPAR